MTTSRREAEDKLTGALAQHRVLHSILVQQTQEFLKVWTGVKKVALGDVAEVSDVDWGTRRFVTQRNEDLASYRTDHVVRVCRNLVSLSSHLTWKVDEDLAEGATVDDRGTWAEMTILAKDVVRMANECQETKDSIKYLRKEMAAVDTRYLHGYYVKVENSRRTIFGWIDKGRGKSTVTITLDPLGMDEGRSLNETRPEDLAERAVSRGVADVGDEKKTSWTDSTSVTVILPPTDASDRRAEVVAACEIVRVTSMEANKKASEVKEWREANQDLVKRRDAVKKILDTFDDFNPFKTEYISTETMKVWVAEAQRLNGPSINSAAKYTMLGRVGGPLTASEETELFSEPVGSSDVRTEWRRLLVERFRTASFTYLISM